jgi:hypothetical protein
MILAFSSTTSGLFSLFNSSQASQNSIFSSEYSHRRKSLKTFRPAGLRISLSKDLPQLLISSKEGGGSPSQFKRSELLEFLLGPFSSFPFPGVEQEQLQQQHQQRQQGLGRSGAPWPGCGPFWGPDCVPAEAGGPALELGGVARLAVLDPRSRQPAPAVAPGPVGGPPPGPALFSVTRSVTLQDIFINGHEGSCRHTCPPQPSLGPCPVAES